MPAFYLLLPFLLIRFALLSFFDKKALGRAAHFAHMQGKERIAYFLYQLSTLILILAPFFLQIRLAASWKGYLAFFLYMLGLLLCGLAMKDFASPDEKGLNTKGLYALSRHPMYLAYFLYFLGLVLLTQSYFLLINLVIFQVSAHFIILAEERECLKKFGTDYQDYKKRVRMYL